MKESFGRKNSNKSSRDEIKNAFFFYAESSGERRFSRGDNGVVIPNFGSVVDAFAFAESFLLDDFYMGFVWGNGF